MRQRLRDSKQQFFRLLCGYFVRFSLFFSPRRAPFDCAQDKLRSRRFQIIKIPNFVRFVSFVVNTLSH